jgi:hypothetical protein
VKKPPAASRDDDQARKRRKAAAVFLSPAALPAAGAMLEADPRLDDTSETEASLKRAAKRRPTDDKGAGRTKSGR